MLRPRAKSLRVAAVGEPRLRPGVVGRERLDLRVAHHPDRPAARRHPDAGRRTDRGRAAPQHGRRGGAARRIRRRRMGRSTPTTAGAHLGRPRSGAAARVDPSLVRPRDAPAMAAHRGRRAGRRADDLLRRGRQRVPADDRRTRAPRRGEQRARRERLRGGVRRVRDQRLPGPAPDRPDHDPHRRGDVPRLGGPAALGQTTRAASAAALRARTRPRRDPAGTADRARLADPRAFVGAQMLMSALWGVFGATWFLFAIEELESARPSASSPASAARRPSSARSWRPVDAALGASGRWPSGDAPRGARQPVHPARAGRLARGRDRVLPGPAAGRRLGDHRLRRHRDVGPPVARRRPGARQGRLDVPGRVGGGATRRDDRGGTAGRGDRPAATAFLAPLGGLLAAAILYWSPVRHLRDLPIDGLRGRPRSASRWSAISRSAPDLRLARRTGRRRRPSGRMAAGR